MKKKKSKSWVVLGHIAETIATYLLVVIAAGFLGLPEDISPFIGGLFAAGYVCYSIFRKKK